MSVDWQRVKELFNEAVELPAEEREAFLGTACAGDLALRREVDGLIAADDEAAGFLPEPEDATGTTATAAAADIATEPGARHEAISSGKLRFCPRCSGRFSTADIVCPVDGEVLVEDPEALVDTTIDGLYHVTRMIGRGGFGVVYLARHALLRDFVAIKVLPRQLSSDPERIERFLREGRAARAISHPNLVTVYDLRASKDGLTYMVQEYVEGHTLRDELELRGKFAPGDALVLLEPIAAALDEAHAHGIVHRDLKPDNIMLSVSGAKRTAKLLDLGIVKLQEILSEPSGADHNVTHPGHFIGTPSYMSPEQWGTPQEDGGPDIDGRADVYSFGVVMFEMLSGRQPFRGRSMSEIRRAHLIDPPPLLCKTDPLISRAFSETLARAMAKARTDRPATAGAFMSELRAALETSSRPLSAAQAAMSSLPTHEIPPTEVAPSSQLEEPEASRGARRWHAVRSVAAAVGIAAALGVAGYGGWRFVQPAQQEEPARQMPAVTADAGELITNTGTAVDAAISPDGARVATVMRVGSQYQLSVVHLPTRGTVPLGEPTEARLYGLTFSPDGNYVYFVEEPKDGDSVLSMISIGGGSAQRVLSDIESGVTFSPRGDEVAYVRSGSQIGVRELVIASADGAKIRAVATTQGSQLFATEGPSWSPDGEKIACSILDFSDGFRGFVGLVTVADGSLASLTTPNWFYVGQIQLVANGTRLLASAAKEPMGSMQLWDIAFPSGSIEPYRSDLNSNDGIGVSEDGKLVVSVRTSLPTSIWTRSLTTESDERQLPLGTTRFYGVSWTRDGRVLYSASTRGTPDIWLAEADGRNARQITFEDSIDRDPVMSPDGRFVFFSSNRAGAFNIWRIRSDGTEPTQLTFGADDAFPSCSMAGDYIVFQGYENLLPGLWRVGYDGGTPVSIGTSPAKWPALSPDGNWIACTVLDTATQSWKAALFPVSGNAAPRHYDVPMLSVPRFEWQRVRWSGDGLAITYLADEGDSTVLYSLALSDGVRTRLFTTHGGKILSYDVRDGVLVCARAPITSDIVLIRDF
ncbi:MAG: serine/threonine-protein kinase [Blastocatellia bacterium]|nr:serine/threonine-protein kinase [Blastocatellia bacterium]